MRSRRSRASKPSTHPLSTLALVLGLLGAVGAVGVAGVAGITRAQEPDAATGLGDSAEPPREHGRAWAFRVMAEGGAGSRDFELPVDGVVQLTETGAFPVAGAGVEIDHRASESVVLGVRGKYQSSLGLGIAELHTDGSSHPVDVRAHRLEAGFVPAFAFDASFDFALLLTAGYAVLGFRPLSHLVTPAFSLSGPFLRAELRVPIVSDVLRLRFGPEGQWIVFVGDELLERGLAASGFGVGGEASLEVQLGARVVLGAAYRESWSLLSSSRDARGFKDVARFVTARLTGRL